MADAPVRLQRAVFGRLRVKQLELLSLLAHSGSITAAARELNVSQPAVSAMLRELESVVETPLLRRQARGVVLEPAGVATLRRFEAVLAELNAVPEEARLATNCGAMRLRIGALSLAMIGVLPRALSKLLERRPEARISLVEGTIEELAKAMTAGELDCVVGRIPSSVVRAEATETLMQTRLSEEPLCFVCARDHPLATRTAVSLTSLAEQPWLLPPMKSSTRAAFGELFVSAGLFPPVPVIESSSFHSNLMLVQQTKLVTIAPRALADQRASAQDVRVLDTPHNLAPVPVSVIYRSRSLDDGLLASFITAAQDAVGQVGQGARASTS